MRNRNIVATLIICVFLCACGTKATTTIEPEQANKNEADLEISTYVESEESEVEASNRTIIAEALGVEENQRNIKFILGHLNTIGVVQVTKAELAEENGEAVLDLESDNQKKYRVYLSGSGSVEAIKDLDTGEWLIKSEK